MDRLAPTATSRRGDLRDPIVDFRAVHLTRRSAWLSGYRTADVIRITRGPGLGPPVARISPVELIRTR
jgi:hypothetical protein